MIEQKEVNSGYDMLNQAILIAADAHYGQRDKGGNSYILHPLTLMLKAKEAGYGLDEQIVAVLHDVVEDTDISLEILSTKYVFYASILNAIDNLTRRKDETYTEFIVRAKTLELSTRVKILDIKHNLDLDRLLYTPAKAFKDLKRISKYTNALMFLKNNINEEQFRKIAKENILDY